MGTNTNHANHFNNNPPKNAFLEKLSEELEANFQNEQFGVEALANQMNMSRSHLHRKLKQATGQSPNQFIREYRLQRAMELLKQEDITISEVAYQVGFGSHSYFTSCFTEYYGYPPGEAKLKLQEISPVNSLPTFEEHHLAKSKSNIAIGSLAILGVLIILFLYHHWSTDSGRRKENNISTDKSIAVLPFKNLSPNQENEYFSEGVTEAINRHLSQISDLRVISSTSTAQYRKNDQSAQKIARELNVANLLEGSIQRHENMIRIEVRLIDTQTEKQIWAAKYDREMEDIFKTQSEIAEQVALSLKRTLSPEERSVLNQATTENAEAYDLYLKGTYENNTYTRTGNDLASEYFRRAIQLDSSYALAFTGLALTYIAKASMFGSELSARDAFIKAKPLLDKALALDPGLIEAHTWNAFYLLYNNWDFERAEQAYKKAIATNYSHALAVYADFLNFTRRHDEALTIARRLDQVDPYFLNSRMVLALYYTKQYDEATAFAEARMKVFKNYFTLDNYGFLMLNTGNYPKAIELFQRVMDIEGIRYPRILGWIGAAYAQSGQAEKAQALIEELKAKILINDAGSLRFFIAVIYAALNDKHAALQWLKAAYKYHEMEMPWIISEPQFYELHEEAEFQELVDKMGFP